MEWSRSTTDTVSVYLRSTIHETNVGVITLACGSFSLSGITSCEAEKTHCDVFRAGTARPNVLHLGGSLRYSVKAASLTKISAISGGGSPGDAGVAVSTSVATVGAPRITIAAAPSSFISTTPRNPPRRRKSRGRTSNLLVYKCAGARRSAA